MDTAIRQEEFERLEIEKKLVIYLSRLTFSTQITHNIQTILDDPNLNWFEFYKHALYHKVMTLCWHNLRQMFASVFPPKYLNDTLNALYLATTKRNQLYQQEISCVQHALQLEGIVAIPVKGAYLIPLLYRDYGLRYSGDADFLIKSEDLSRAEDIMQTLGYIKGKYNPVDGTIQPISRAEQIKWKSFMSNGHPLLKLSANPLFPVYKLDFRYALSDNLSSQPIDEIVNAYSSQQTVRVAHYLIHLCAHFYDEAKHAVDIVLAKDFNLIKLCDIREYIVQFATEEDLRELVNFAQQHGLTQQVYYTFYVLQLIYHDGYEVNVLHALGITEESFLYTVGDNTLHATQRLDQSIYDRLFACGSMKTMIDTPKFFL